MNGIPFFIVLFVVLFIFLNYNYYKQKRREYIEEKRQETLMLDDFFYHPSILKTKRRKIWIHIPLERNERHWQNFGSRSSTQLNLSVANLCIKSIIDWCSQSYDIILFTDADIPEILKSTADLSILSGDELEKRRQQYLLEILYEHGGILLPHTIYLRNNIKHQDALDRWFVVDVTNTTHVSESSRIPSIVITGSPAKDPQLRDYLDYLKRDLKTEFSDNYFLKNDIFILDGSIFGTKNKKKQSIQLDDLMSTKNLKLPETNIGLYLPYHELMKRTLYKWYIRMNEKQILTARCAFSHYMIENS
jgi:hypothetical protein